MIFKGKVHNYEEARKSAGPGRIPALVFTEGTRHGLKPCGTHFRVDEKVRGKAARKAEKRARREAREESARNALDDKVLGGMAP